MNNLLNTLYNEVLGRAWDMEGIKNRLNAMTKTLKSKATNVAEVTALMQNQSQVEDLMKSVAHRFNELGITLEAFNDLDREISSYYEEN